MMHSFCIIIRRVGGTDRPGIAHGGLDFATGTLEYDQLIDTGKGDVPDTQFMVNVATAEAVRIDPLATPDELREQTQILYLLWMNN